MAEMTLERKRLLFYKIKHLTNSLQPGSRAKATTDRAASFDRDHQNLVIIGENRGYSRPSCNRRLDSPLVPKYSISLRTTLSLSLSLSLSRF
ncbi:hypothetical protein RJT34_25120 [Clitoria ternatea]|uniref:Uncharacterized protein n=1 Tax=Clitoria ternatea TaxID=43366 RepID=A0AAN9IGK0_CLITE